MPSSRTRRGAAAVATFAAFAASLVTSAAEAQQQPQGFAVERFYPSPAGAGWLVMDDLDLRGGLGGAIELTSGYAYRPLRVSGPNGQSLPVVSDQAFADVSAAITYDRFRFSLDFPGPLVVAGSTGMVNGYQYTAPATDGTTHPVDLGTNPDTFSDVRLGVDARLLGEVDGPFRLGASAQLWVPSGKRYEYITDDTYRGMFRVLAAGDVGWFTYAGQLGVHVRPFDQSPIPDTPRGSELLFGAAAGARFPVATGKMAFVVGPEVYGETAFLSFFGTQTTGVEALLSGRLEGTAKTGGQLRIKLGAGGGLDPNFGAPQFRAVVAIEIFARSVTPTAE
jgi:hypothetical protein